MSYLKERMKELPKNIEIHFSHKDSTIEMIYDFENKTFIINTPGQEMVCFDTLEESENTIIAIQKALKYIKNELQDNSK